MKKSNRYLSLFLIWGIFLSLEIIFVIIFYKEATRVPVEFVGSIRKQNAICAAILFSIVLFIACFIWFFIWKIIWKNHDIFESLLAVDEKGSPHNFSDPFFPLILHENILIINKGISIEKLNINSIIWIHTHRVIQEYLRYKESKSLIIYFYKGDGKKVKIQLEPSKISLFWILLDKILSNNPQIRVSKGFLSKEYKKQKEWYKNFVRYS